MEMLSSPLLLVDSVDHYRVYLLEELVYRISLCVGSTSVVKALQVNTPSREN
jgi:hypothetical protein